MHLALTVPSRRRLLRCNPRRNPFHSPAYPHFRFKLSTIDYWPFYIVSKFEGVQVDVAGSCSCRRILERYAFTVARFFYEVRG